MRPADICPTCKQPVRQRGWMSIDPEAAHPSLASLLWLAVLIGGFFALLALIHHHP